MKNNLLVKRLVKASMECLNYNPKCKWCGRCVNSEGECTNEDCPMYGCVDPTLC